MIVIVDNGGANLASVRSGFARLGADTVVSNDPARVASADRVVVPGVGAAADGMARLSATGLDAALRACTKPVLGICLGMQLLYEHSGEGAIECLGVLPGVVTRFTDGPRIPHMGWSRVFRKAAHPLLDGIKDGEWFYFAHSYRADTGPATIGVCEHGGEFSAAAARDNFAGVQFHPERSGQAGARLLANFLAWQP